MIPHSHVRRLGLAALLALSLAFASAPPNPATPAHFPPGFVFEHVARITGFVTSVAVARDGRAYLARKEGRIDVYHHGVVEPEPFIDLSPETNAHWDNGLTGIALHPDFPATPWLYVFYVYDPPGTAPDADAARVSRVERIAADPDNLNRASSAPDARRVIVGANSTREHIGDEHSTHNLDAPSCVNALGHVDDCIPADSGAHNAGKLAFAPDGALLVATGEAGLWIDPRSLRAMDLDSLSGKILRVNAYDGAGLSDNPFFDGDPGSNRSKVLYLGLRNPFRFSIHPTTGQVFIGDVGWDEWEELNIAPPGANFGWPCYEGRAGDSARQPGFETSELTADQCAAEYAVGARDGALTAATFAYTRGQTGRDMAVIAGAVYSGTGYAEAYRGALFLLDFSRRWIKTVTFDEAGRPAVADFADDLPIWPVDTASGPNGDLFIVGPALNGEGSGLYRLWDLGGANAPPVADLDAHPTAGPLPLEVRFSGERSHDPEASPLLHVWDFGDGESSFAVSPTHIYTRAGWFTATLTVADALGSAARQAVLIRAGESPPSLAVTPAMSGTRLAAGEAVTLTAEAAAEDGADLSARIQWRGYLHHKDHVHPDAFFTEGAVATVTMMDHGDDTWLELCAEVEDDRGLAARRCERLLPLEASYSLATSPPGLRLTYDGTSRLAPFVVRPVVGGARQLAAPLTQGCLRFTSWSDGAEEAGRALHIEAGEHSLTALYEAGPCPQSRVLLPIVGR